MLGEAQSSYSSSGPSTKALGGGLQGGPGYAGDYYTVTGGTQINGGQSAENNYGKIYDQADFGIAGRGTGGTYGTSRDGGNGWYGGRLCCNGKHRKLLLCRWWADLASF